MATIFTDNFNSYTDGDLNGQGGWSGSVDFDVQGSVVKEGAKAVQLVGAAGGAEISKTGTEIATGKTSFYIRKTSITLGPGYSLEFGFRLNTTYRHGGRFWGDKIQIEDGAGNNTADVATGLSANTWYLVEYEYTSTQHRARVDGGSWTAWQGNYTSGNVNNIRFREWIESGQSAYFDHIAEEPALTLKSVSDSGSGVEMIIVKQFKSLADSGVGADQVSAKPTIKVTNTGQGTDLISILRKIFIGDTGTGQDSIALITNKLKVSDTGTGVETIIVKLFKAISDVGQGIETIASKIKALISDTGSGTDIIKLIKAKVSVQDVGAGVDAVKVILRKFVSDAGSGVVAIVSKIKVLIQDIGKGIVRIKVPPFYTDKYSKQGDVYHDKY